MSPTSRSKVLLEEQGWITSPAQRWNVFARKSEDAFGFIDILAIKPDNPGVLAVQSTTGSNASTRVKKILGLDAARIWLLARNRIVVHAWAKRGSKGERKLWTLREVWIREEDFVEMSTVRVGSDSENS